MSESAGALSGVTVIDLGQIYMAPCTTLLLGLAGARVIKVEPLDGEHLRARGDTRGAGYPCLMLNSNRQGITLNLKSEPGRELLLAMVEKADIVVENFAARVMDPSAPVRGLKEAVADRHLKERGILQEIDHPELGRVTVPTSPFRLSEHPVTAPRPAPSHGQHNREVFGAWLGVSDEELGRLKEEAVI